MLIVLLRGYSHSGKDFVGNILCKHYGFHRFAFADSLKKIVSHEFECSLETLHCQYGKLQICESDPKKRTYRQILLDEAIRLKSDNPDIFADFCCQDIQKSGKSRIVITDWRFPNEKDIILKNFPNATIKIVEIIRIGQYKSPVQDESEYLLKGIRSDIVIFNQMNNEIYKRVDRALELLEIRD